MLQKPISSRSNTFWETREELVTIVFYLISSLLLGGRGVVAITNTQLHSANSDSAQVQDLLAACRRFKMVGISDNGPNWK